MTPPEKFRPGGKMPDIVKVTGAVPTVATEKLPLVPIVNVVEAALVKAGGVCAPPIVVGVLSQASPQIAMSEAWSIIPIVDQVNNR
jgi:hypothetical protein